MIEISSECMTLLVGREVIGTAWFSKDAAADGNGAWIVSIHPLRLFHRDQAVTALTLAERLAAGFGANLAHGLNHGPIGALVRFRA